MQLGRVEGRATTTIKHPSLAGWPLLVVQPLDAARQADGYPILVLDRFGARHGDTVVLTSDGQAARELVADPKSPARWFVMGIADEYVEPAGVPALSS